MQCSKIAPHSPEYKKLETLILPYFNNFGIIDYVSRPLHDLDTKNMFIHEVTCLTFYKCVLFGTWKYCVAILPTFTTKNNIKTRKSYCLFFKIDLIDIPGILPETVKLIPMLDTDKFSYFCESLCFEPDCRCSEILTCELCDIDMQAKKIKYRDQVNGLLLTYPKNSPDIPKPAKAQFLSYFKICSLSHGSNAGEYENQFRFINNTFIFEVLEHDFCVDSFTFNIINDTYIRSE
jgi:hypothetical protein